MTLASDRAKWYVLITTATGAFMGAMMFTSVNVALPSLVGAFDTEFNVVQWVVLAYILAMGSLLPIVGRLADMYGKKALYIAGYVTFMLGTLLAALSPSVIALIVARTVQGVGSAGLTALGLAILTDVFPPEERGRAIGINGSILSVGIVAGPSLGGLLIDALSWQWIFWVALPVALVATLLALRFVPRYQRGPKRRFDIPGAALLFVSLLALSLALTLGQSVGFAAPSILALFALSAVGFALFMLTELRAAEPVLDPRLFRNRQLSIGLATGFATFISIAGVVLLMPFYLENVLGFSTRNVGLLMSVVPVVLVIAAPLAGAAADRWGERPVTVVGLIMLFGGYLTLSTLSETTSALGYLLRFLPVGLGMGIFQTPNNSAIMGSVSRDRSGVAGGLLALTRTLGQSAGIAVLGSLWAARVIARAGSPPGSDATSAATNFQVAGLGDLFLVVQVTMALALGLALWDLLRQRRLRLRAIPANMD